eukprot:INCI1753.1.p1 GENE.INCI1753.1~~INCI1753.1.p1  ORF type:complete len:493 (+),score=62.35 INCI1753.1:291-1769(+)
MPRRKFQPLGSAAQHPRVESKTYLSSPTQESKRHNQFKEISLEHAVAGPPLLPAPKRGNGWRSPVGGASNATTTTEQVDEWSHADDYAEDKDWSMHWDNTYQQYYWLHTSGYSEWVQQDEQQTFGDSSEPTGLGQSSGMYDDAGEENKANHSQAQLKATRSFRRLSLDTKVSRIDSFSPSPSPGFSQLAISALGEEVSTIRGTGEDGGIGDDSESTASQQRWRSMDKHQTQRLVQMFGLSPRGHHWPVRGVNGNHSDRSAAGTINSHRDAESARHGRSLLERALTSPARGPPLLHRASSFDASRSRNVSKMGSLSFAAPSMRTPPRSFANESYSAPEGSRSRLLHPQAVEDGDDSSFSSPPHNYRSMRVSFGEESTLGRFTADTAQYNVEHEEDEEEEDTGYLEDGAADGEHVVEGEEQQPTSNDSDPAVRAGMAAAALYHSVLRLSAHWLECHDEASGLPFYVNPYSQESTWDPPQEFQEAEWEGRLSTLV